MANVENNIERWVPVLGYIGLYEASDRGNIMNLNYRGTKQRRILKLKKSSKGYHIQVTLRKDKKSKTLNVHQLVLDSFLGPEENSIASHIDGNKQNNELTNLEWHPIQQNENEKFVPIFEYEDIYEISDWGRIKKLHCNKSTKGDILKPQKTKLGYLRIGLCKNKKDKHHFVHRLVLTSFLGNQEGMTTNHINGNKEDNSLSNLEWCTQRENNIHALNTKLRVNVALKGEKSVVAKLNDKKIREIRLLYSTLKGTELAIKYGMSNQAIYDILSRKTWKHVV